MTEVKRHVEIAGYGICLPKNTVQFKDQTRYRVVENEETQLDLADVDYIIPHQASRALPLVMEKLGVAEDQYLNLVTDYGNMVSVSVPFGLAYSLEHGLIKEGDVVYLMGTAAGMTVNMLALKL